MGKNEVHAIAAMVFFTALEIALLYFGYNQTRALVMFAMFLGAAGQFIAQDYRQFWHGVALGMSWSAMILTGFAILGFAVAGY